MSAEKKSATAGVPPQGHAAASGQPGAGQAAPAPSAAARSMPAAQAAGSPLSPPAAAAAAKPLRADLAIIAGWIRPYANVLDLGCGDGALLAHLERVKHCHGYGVEIDDAEVQACARHGVDVIQRNIEDGLEMFMAGDPFDVVVLSMALQATQRTEKVLEDMSPRGHRVVSQLRPLVPRLVHPARPHADHARDALRMVQHAQPAPHHPA